MDSLTFEMCVCKIVLFLIPLVQNEPVLQMAVMPIRTKGAGNTLGFIGSVSACCGRLNR